MVPSRSWNAPSRVALAGVATALVILAVRLAPPPGNFVPPRRYHYYYIDGPGGPYSIGPGDGIVGLIRLWTLQSLPFVPSILVAILGATGLVLAFRRAGPPRS